MDIISIIGELKAGKVQIIITLRPHTVLFEFQCEGMTQRTKLCLVYTKAGASLPDTLADMLPTISQQFPQFEFSVVVIDRMTRHRKRR